jgi:DNA invertase Pin-like site-specific DNA recombinase
MIIGYLRVSTEKQNPENQRDEIRRFAEEKSLAVDSWVVETASGKLPYRKRKLGRLLRRLRSGTHSTIPSTARYYVSHSVSWLRSSAI